MLLFCSETSQWCPISLRVKQVPSKAYATQMTCFLITFLASTAANFTFTHSSPAMLVFLLFLKHLRPLAWKALPRRPHGPPPHLLHMFPRFSPSQWGHPATYFNWTFLPSSPLALLISYPGLLFPFSITFMPSNVYWNHLLYLWFIFCFPPIM